MKVKMIMGVVAGMLVTTSFAQNQYDALRFLGDELNGTARFVGMGGAMSALGADISTMSTNPAGIGLYRSNDVALSFGWNSNKSSADWGGSVSNENRGRASFDQIGFVWSTKIGNKTNLRYVNFGFNYHKRANFNRQFSAKGNLNGLSLTNQMAGMLLNAGDESGLYYLTNSDFETYLKPIIQYVEYIPDNMQEPVAYYNGRHYQYGIESTSSISSSIRCTISRKEWDSDSTSFDSPWVSEMLKSPSCTFRMSSSSIRSGLVICRAIALDRRIAMRIKITISTYREILNGFSGSRSSSMNAIPTILHLVFSTVCMIVSLSLPSNVDV